MSRLPFNPQNMAAKAASEPAASASSDPAAGTISVAELSALIEATLDNLPQPMRVIGEVGQFTDKTHWYFSLKDQQAVVSCVMWKQAAARVGFVPSVGQRVVLTGTVQYYAPSGRLSFIATKLEPVGIGALDLAFRKLCEELRALGWFALERKRPLPFLPRKVAIVTSRTGAALQDVIVTIHRRFPALPLALVDVRVQGEGAATEVAEAIRALGRHRMKLGVDLILVTRGGGSMEDLWAFNERIVAEAIVNSPIPVVAAIGHETDTTIAELVADLRCATPTQAAMHIAPDRDALAQQIESLNKRLAVLLRKSVLQPNEMRLATESRRLAYAARDSIRQSSARLDRVGARLERHRPAALYAQREARLRHAASRLEAVILARAARHDLPTLRKRLDSTLTASFRRSTAAIDAAARGLDLVGPQQVLNRGYSVTLSADGSVLRSASAARPGETINTRLAEGTLQSVVSGSTSTTPILASAPQPQPPTPQRRSPDKQPRPPADKPRDQMDLF